MRRTISARPNREELKDGGVGPSELFPDKVGKVLFFTKGTKELTPTSLQTAEEN